MKVMNDFFFILMLICLLCILPFFIVFIVQAVRKRKKAVWGFLSLGCFVGTIVFAIIGALLTPVCDHEYNLLEEKAANCVESGYTLYECEKCGEDKKEEHEALGHDLVIESQKDASDAEDGEIVKQCSRCDYTESTVVPKPTKEPTKKPTDAPTQAKTEKPTEKPTAAPTKAPTAAPKKTKEDIEEEFKAGCGTIEYETLARNPEKHKGNTYKITGKVKQVVESSSLFGDETTLLIDVTETKYDYIDTSVWSDTIYAKVTIGDGEDRILEDDIITIWGTCKGAYTYNSIFNQSITVPRIDIEYFEIK